MLISGHPPVNAEHIFNFKQYLDAFPHPCPTDGNSSGSTLPTAAPIITENLQGIFVYNCFVAGQCFPS